MELSVIERRDLKQHEKVIEKGLSTFLEVGQALRTVRDEKLYRENYKTFEAYVKGRFEMDKSYAYRLIDAVDVKEDLSPIGDKITLPATESQYRELAKIPEDIVADVWTEVVKDCEEKGEKPTAAKIKQTVKEKQIPPKPEPDPEPEEPKPEKDWKHYRAKARKTAEALLRAVDDLDDAKPSNQHEFTIAKIAEILEDLDGWK